MVYVQQKGEDPPPDHREAEGVVVPNRKKNRACLSFGCFLFPERVSPKKKHKSTKQKGQSR